MESSFSYQTIRSKYSSSNQRRRGSPSIWRTFFASFSILKLYLSYVEGGVIVLADLEGLGPQRALLRELLHGVFRDGGVGVHQAGDFQGDALFLRQDLVQQVHRVVGAAVGE